MTGVTDQLRISFADIPDEVMGDALAYVAGYAVGLIRLEDSQLMGSGTLVRVGNKSGILTARHVLDGFSKVEELGLILPKPNREKSFPMMPRIRIDATKQTTFPLETKEDAGPDLAFVELALADVAWIGAIKSFRNLEKARMEILSDDRNFPGSAFIVVGYPEEKSSKVYSQDRRELSMNFPGGLYLSQIEYLPDANAFDYVELTVEHNQQDDPPPRSFGGYSGGGLWHVQMTGNTGGELKFTRGRLFGVAFYQSGIVDGRSRIRCHFRRSVYEQLFNKVVGSI